MQHGEEELTARAKGAVKTFTTRIQHQTDELTTRIQHQTEELTTRLQHQTEELTTRLQHQTEELKKEGSRVALAAIRKARASLGRWDTVVAAWGKHEEHGPPDSSPAPESEGPTGSPPPN
jgi:exonuclease VII large subunit